MSSKIFLPKRFYTGHPEKILNSASNIFKPTEMYKTFIVVDDAHCVVEWGMTFVLVLG